MPPTRDPGHPRRGSADEAGPNEYSLAARPVRCPHCGGSQFTARDAQLNTALATLLNLDWTDRSAKVLICTTCSQIQWFAEAPSRVP